MSRASVGDSRDVDCEKWDWCGTWGLEKPLSSEDIQRMYFTQKPRKPWSVSALQEVSSTAARHLGSGGTNAYDMPTMHRLRNYYRVITLLLYLPSHIHSWPQITQHCCVTIGRYTFLNITKASIDAQHNTSWLFVAMCTPDRLAPFI